MKENLVNVNELTMNTSSSSVSISNLIADADPIVQLVIILLLLASFWSWAIIFDKFIKINAMNKKITRFEKVFWSGQLLEQLYERIKKYPDHPMASIFVVAMQEWLERNNQKNENNDVFFKIGLKERIFQAMNLVKGREISKLERSLTFLATVGSSSPFIGLFGTVWGIMNSFQSIANTKTTTIAVVAPGIAEALLATAIGLFAAIPAVIFYNLLAKNVNTMENKLEDFSTELGTILSREIDLGEK